MRARNLEMAEWVVDNGFAGSEIASRNRPKVARGLAEHLEARTRRALERACAQEVEMISKKCAQFW
jgi:hypothetical protein